MLTVREIDSILNAVPLQELHVRLDDWRDDPRSGVRKLVEKYEKRLQAYRDELARLDRMMLYERKYADYELICGIDEAGRGPLAGPVCAAAVILPKDEPILYVNDSKQLSAAKREELYGVITEKAVTYGIALVNEKEIDRINILQATYEAMRQAVAKLSPQPRLSLNDAVTVPGLPIRQVPIVKGDAKSCSIAAASVLAKVTRDRLMAEYDKLYPEYGFAAHKGYGAASHIEALKKYGPCPIHRLTFIRNILNGEGNA